MWVAPADQGFVVVGSNVKLLISSFDAEAGGAPRPTMVRNRGAVVHRPTALAADIEYSGAFGVGVVSAQAFAIGITALPGPWSDADWSGWMVWRSFAGAFDVTSDISRILLHTVLEVDSKAMRKIGPNDIVVTMAESATGGFDIFDGVRQLLKLS